MSMVARRLLSTSAFIGAIAVPLATASAADLGPVVVPGEAAPGFIVIGDIWGGYVFMDDGKVDPGDEPEETGRMGGSVRIALPLGAALGAQIDLDGEFDFDNDDNGGNTRDYTDALSAGAHLTWRGPGFALGAIGAYQEAGIDGQQDEDAWLVGGEGQINFANSLAFVQAGHFESSENDSESLTDAWFVRGGGSYFFDPDSMLSLSLLYGEGEDTQGGGSNSDIEVLGWGVEYRQQVAGWSMPLSWFVGYNGHNIWQDDSGGATELTEHVVRVGFSIAFGAGAGSSLQTIHQQQVMPGIPLDMIRATGYTADVVD